MAKVESKYAIRKFFEFIENNLSQATDNPDKPWMNRETLKVNAICHLNYYMNEHCARLVDAYIRFIMQELKDNEIVEGYTCEIKEYPRMYFQKKLEPVERNYNWYVDNDRLKTEREDDI